MNRGDAQTIVLNIKIDDEPAAQDDFEEIEVTFNPELQGHSVRKLLSAGDIYWDPQREKFCLDLYQEDTFTFHPGDNTWQLRVMYGDIVISTPVKPIRIGFTNSKHKLQG